MPSDEFEVMVGMLEAAGLRTAPTLADQRAGIDGLGQLLPMAAGTSFVETDCDGVPSGWIIPGHPDGQTPGSTLAHSPLSAVMWLHGGGYSIGGIESHKALASYLAAAAGVPVLVPAYRLAPEHPYPAALDDADTVWRWLVAQGNDPSSIALGGDSAGGGLALALATRMSGSNRALPGALVLLCPWVDLTGQHPVPQQRLDADVVLSPAMLQEWAAGYAGDTARDDPGVSPLFGNLRGLPPLFIGAGGRDTLLGDASRLAESCASAGVHAELRVDDDMIHAWQLFAGAFPEAGESIADVAYWLHATLKP
jgi:epsilon-lactone hydrolase